MKHTKMTFDKFCYEEMFFVLAVSAVLYVLKAQ